MATTISANMSLPVPVVGNEPGPTYASDINQCMTTIDAHNHSTGSGVPITPSGITISSDLPFGGNNATLLRSVRFSSQSSVLVAAADVGCLYESGADLYFNDGNGTSIRITQSGGVVGTPGSISGLASPASATYVSGTKTFVWQSDVNTPANMDFGSIILRNISASSNGMTLNPPAAMGSNFAITFPTLPGSQSFMTLDAAGALATPAIYPLTNAGIANSTITGSQTQTNISLPGSNVKIGNQKVVVSNTNASASFCVLRGAITSGGAPSGGEGFSASRSSAGVYVITFTTPFADSPGFTANSFSSGFVVSIDTVNSVSAQVRSVVGNTGAVGDSNIIFIAIGQRV